MSSLRALGYPLWTFCTSSKTKVRATAKDHRSNGGVCHAFLHEVVQSRSTATASPHRHAELAAFAGFPGGLGAVAPTRIYAALEVLSGSRSAAESGLLGSRSVARISASETFSGWWHAARWPLG